VRKSNSFLEKFKNYEKPLIACKISPYGDFRGYWRRIIEKILKFLSAVDRF
jgi:hypothetical protein